MNVSTSSRATLFGVAVVLLNPLFGGTLAAQAQDSMPSPRPRDAVIQTQEAEEDLGGFYGTVRSTGMKPVVSATITLPELGRMAITNGQGEFYLRDLPTGRHAVEVEYLGLKYPAEIDVTPGKLLLKHYRLDLTLAQLDPIRVQAEAEASSLKMREFVARQARAAGFYFDRADIAAMMPTSTLELLTGLPGVRVRDNVGPGRTVDIGRGSGRCRPNLFIDGTYVESFGPDDYIPHLIEAVEVYQSFSQTPIQYRTGSRCGAIIIWTRETFD